MLKPQSAQIDPSLRNGGGSYLRRTMKHTITYKFKLFPTSEQEAFVENQLYGLRRIYNAMIEYIFNDKILFRENVDAWVEKRMNDCYGKENARSSAEGKEKYRDKLNKKVWFHIDSAKLTLVVTKIKKTIKNFDGSDFDSSYLNANAIVSMIRNDFSRAIEQIKKEDSIYKEDGKWFIEKFSKKENKSIKYPLKTIKGYPKWKKKEDRSSYYEDVSAGNNISIDNKNGYIDISKLKDPIKFYIHREMIAGKILQKKTIIKDIDGSWWICLQVSFEKDEVLYPITRETTIGVDLGQKTHGVASNGDTLETDPNYVKLNIRMKKLQRIVSRKFEEKYENDKKTGERSKKSKNLIKAQKELNKIQIMIRNVRKNLIDNFTNKIISDDNVNTIVLENLSIKKMIRVNKDPGKKYRSKRVRASNKSLHNSAMYMIRNNFRYKAEFLGKNVIIAKKEFPSTQLCSCGEKTGPKGTSQLHVREWTCSKCGKLNNRDGNASDNLAEMPFKYRTFVDFAESGVQAIRDFGDKPDKYVNR